jgi:hypothetical protein
MGHPVDLKESPMPKPTKSLEERLQAHPELKEQLLGLLELAESGIDSADEVEALAVEGSKGLGRQVMQEWAERRAQEKAQALREADAGVSSKGKKNSTGRRRSGR